MATSASAGFTVLSANMPQYIVRLKLNKIKKIYTKFNRDPIESFGVIICG
jgi:hypothetical protein